MSLIVDESEVIVRAIKAPSHLNSKTGKPKLAAFKARNGHDDVSVIRHSHVGSDFCKRKGQLLTDGRDTYLGLAVLTARQIRDAVADVVDSRNVYCGHADITYGFLRPPNEPNYARENMILDERARKIADTVMFYKDPTPTSKFWVGEELAPRP